MPDPLHRSRRAGFRQADLSRALKSVAAAGVDPREYSVTITPSGEIRLDPVSAAGEARGRMNSVDRLLGDAQG